MTEVWEAALAAPAWDRPPVWIHGDLDAGNLLTVDGRLSADGGTSRFERSRELGDDFGTLAVADPAVDLQPAWKFLPSPARDAFREAVGLETRPGRGGGAGPSRGRCRCRTTRSSGRTPHG